MPFQKGHGKMGGRKKGSKELGRRTVQEACEHYGVDPLIELFKLIPDLNAPQQAKTWLAILPYLHPTQRTVEVSGEIEMLHNQPLVQITLPSNGREVREEKPELLVVEPKPALPEPE